MSSLTPSVGNTYYKECFFKGCNGSLCKGSSLNGLNLNSAKRKAEISEELVMVNP